MDIRGSLALRLHSSNFDSIDKMYHKDLLCVWFSSINNVYKFLFKDGNRPSTWGPVVEYANTRNRLFIDHINTHNQMYRNDILHAFLSRRRIPNSSSFNDIQKQDIASMIFNHVDWNLYRVPPAWMRQLCMSI
jgi:hypothetical protein